WSCRPSSPLLLVHKPHKPGGIPSDDRVRSHILGHHAAGTYNCVLSDGDVAENRRSGTDGSAFANPGFFNLPVRLGLQPPFARRRPGIHVVDKRYSVAHKDVVFDLDAFTNEGVARDLASAPHSGILLNFDKRCDFRFVADFAAV